MQGPGARKPRGVAKARQGTRARTPSDREHLVVGAFAVGGSCVARCKSGEIVLVSRAIPGETIDAEIPAGPAPRRARVFAVIEASADRVVPACPVLSACGGCDFMHLSVAAQRAAHASVLVGALQRAGLEELPEVVGHAAPRVIAYRTRARLHAQASTGGAQVGYRAAGSHELVPVERCAVLVPELDAVLPLLTGALAGAHGRGEVALALGEGHRPVVDVRWSGEVPPSLFAALDAHTRSGRLAGARVLLEGARTPARFGDPSPRVEGADGAPLMIAESGFAQASDAGGALLARRVHALAGEGSSGPQRIVELFAGSGTLSILLARGAASLVAVEQDAAAAAAARDNLAARGLDARVVVADADSFDVPARVDVVVLDPPRTGARGAVRRILGSGARSVVYVGCDVATFARDVAELARGGYALTHLEALELFPQTSHVESLARLVRVQPGPGRAT